MLYRITIMSAPKIVLLGFFIPVLGFAAFLSFPFLGIVPGIISVIIVGYVNYIAIRYIYKKMRTSLETSADGFSLDLHGEEHFNFGWKDIMCAGLCSDEKGRRVLFVYIEETDKLIIIPEELNRFDELVDEMKRKLVFHRFTLTADETLKDKVKQLLEKK